MCTIMATHLQGTPPTMHMHMEEGRGSGRVIIPANSTQPLGRNRQRASRCWHATQGDRWCGWRAWLMEARLLEQDCKQET